jgi:hypothetical protein
VCERAVINLVYILHPQINYDEPESNDNDVSSCLYYDQNCSLVST